jgi:hypothetical protein
MYKLSIMVLLSLQSLHALCGEPQPRLLAAEYFDSRMVIEATVTDITQFTAKDETSDDFTRIRLAVNKVYRGPSGRRSEVVTDENNSGRVAFAWIKGEHYLLFVNERGRVDSCGSSGPMKSSFGALQEVQRINVDSPTGILQGVVFQNEPSTKIVIGGLRGFKRTLLTKSDGTFQVSLPKGCFNIRATSQTKKYKEHFLSYGSTINACVPGGGAYQVAFEPVLIPQPVPPSAETMSPPHGWR